MKLHRGESRDKVVRVAAGRVRGKQPDRPVAEAERERSRKTRDATRRKRELEKIRKNHQQDEPKQTQAEAVKRNAGVTAIINQRGKVIGYRQENGSRSTY